MRTPAHLAFGLLSGGVMASLSHSPEVRWGWNGLTLAAVALVLVGAVSPDLDHRQAPIARLLPGLARPLSRRWPHRTLMHSLVGMGLWTFLLYVLLRLVLVEGGSRLGWAGSPARPALLTRLFGFAYTSHLILDTCTRQGVRWLYPLVHNPFGYPSIEHYRLLTGDKRAEWSVTGVSLGLLVWFVPVMLQGAEVSLMNLIGTFKPLQDVYRQAVHAEVVLEFEGYTARDKAPVAGRAWILSMTAQAFVVSWAGTIRQVGEDTEDIVLLRGRCRVLDVPPQVTDVTYHQARLADIVAEYPGPVLLSGELRATQPFTVQHAPQSRTVRLFPSSVTLGYASPAELAAVAVAPVDSGVSIAALTEAHGVLDSLMAVRAGLPETALYARERVYQQIAVQRTIVARLEVARKEHGEGEKEVRWSGRLTIRRMPAWEE